jgi:hypothetical protein
VEKYHTGDCSFGGLSETLFQSMVAKSVLAASFLESSTERIVSDASCRRNEVFVE